jgi:hypothetical protein
MLLHKILRGANAGQYLPFGLARLRALERIKGPKAYWTQKFALPGVTIEVRQSPPCQYVRITADAVLRYEFFTSETIDGDLSTPGFPGYVGGSALRTVFTSTKPLYSTVLVPGDKDTWVLRDTTAPPVDKTTGLITWAGWQDQKLTEHAWYPEAGRGFVSSTKSQALGAGGKCNWRSPYFFTIFDRSDQLSFDYLLDVPPTLYTAGGAVVGYPAFTDPWIYWRHAVVQTVSGTNGGRFFICTDNRGRFHVYRVINREPTWAAVPGQYKTYTPPYPDWVTVPDPASAEDFDSDWLWQFNSDATKCVAIPWHATASGFKKYALSPGGGQYSTMLPEDVPAGVTPSGAVVDGHDDTPGLVEFGITISPTGPGDMDFDVDFTLLRTSYFGDDHRFFFDAAYFMADAEKLGIPKDTLLTAEIECRVPAGQYEATIGSPVAYLDGVRNMQSACVINSNDAVLAPTEFLRFPLWSPIDVKYPNEYGTRTFGGAAPVYTSYDFPSQVPFGAYGGSYVETSGGPVTFFPAGPIRYSSYDSAPLVAGYLYALDLASLSVLYQVSDQTTLAAYVRGVAFGKEFYRKDFTVTELRTSPPLLPTATVVPSARPYQTVFNLMLTTEPGGEFIAHPSGSWSLSGPGQMTRTGVEAFQSLPSDLDWISVVVGKDSDGLPVRKRYRHKDLYNKAFDQTRDYPFYIPAVGGDNSGSFRTSAFWVSF